MENKKISYITLTSDLYILLGISFIIYSIFFGFERIGRASFNIASITNNVAVIICLLEIVFSIVISYMLHKCNRKIVRYIIILFSIFNIIYRILNIMVLSSIFTVFMLIISVILILNILFY